MKNQRLENHIVLYSKSGKIYFFSFNGILSFESVLTQNTPIWNLKILDLNNDNDLELIFGGMDGILRVFKISMPLSLKPLWEHRFNSSISGFLMDDINLDNHLEIIAYSLDKSLRVLKSSNGSLIWGQLLGGGIEDASICLNNDLPPKREILACGNDGTFRVFEGSNGNLLWFKKFSNKVRFISYLTNEDTNFILCGGDDKTVHVIDIKTQNEIKSIFFDDYVWKCFSPLFFHHKKVLISSYSFSHFNHLKNLKDLRFSSKLICLNNNLEVEWELKHINVETLCQINKDEAKYLGIGTTKGELLIVSVDNGKILTSISQPSSVNGLLYESNSNLLFSCCDNGDLFAYFLN